MTLDSRVPFVRNTFVCLDLPREPTTPNPRARSVSPRGSSDVFARQLHALMYKLTPVWERSSGELEAVTQLGFSELSTPAKGKFGKLELGEETPGSTTTGGESSGEDSESSPRSGGSRKEAEEPELSEEELIRLVPRGADGRLLSIGSLGHDEEGTNCKPCVFAYNEKKKCENGLKCPFCHYPHSPKKRVRLGKSKRMQLKMQQEQT